MRDNNTIITVRLADNETDRDYERFSVSALHDMAKLYAGRNGVIGEDINEKTQRGRILSCEVRTNPNKLTRSGEIYTYLEARVIIPRTNENDKLLNKLMNKTQKGSISCSVRNRVCSLCGETDCTKHKKGTLYHGQLVEKVLNDIIEVYEWAIVKPCDNEITEDNSKDRRIKPSQLKPTRHPPMPDTTIPKATMPDYDKVCMLLNEIGCKFTKQGTMESGNILTIEIDSESIISFGGVAIDFYNDGSFKGFVACE